MLIREHFEVIDQMCDHLVQHDLKVQIRSKRPCIEEQKKSENNEICVALLSLNALFRLQFDKTKKSIDWSNNYREAMRRFSNSKKKVFFC